MPVITVHIGGDDGRHADDAAFNPDKNLGTVFQDCNHRGGWNRGSDGNEAVLFAEVGHITVIIDFDLRTKIAHRGTGFIIHCVKTAHPSHRRSCAGITFAAAGVRCVGRKISHTPINPWGGHYFFTRVLQSDKPVLAIYKTSLGCQLFSFCAELTQIIGHIDQIRLIQLAGY